MSKNPSINFYTSDFLSQTMFLSFEDKGKLIMLYCLQHQHGHLSKEQMEKVCGTLSTDVLGFFKLDAEGKYFNEQIEEASIKREQFIKSQKEKINKRWNKQNTAVDTTVNTTVDTTEIPFENEYEIEKEKEVVIENTEIGNGVVRGKGKRFQKPTKEEVIAYAKEKGLRTDIVDKWFNHYESNGWKVGRNPMRDWKASYRNWNLNNYGQPNNKGSSNPFKDRLRKLEEEEKIIEAEQI